MKIEYTVDYIHKILNRLISDHELFDVIKYHLKPEHFTSDGHRWVYEQLTNYNQQNNEYVDYVDLTQRAKEIPHDVLRASCELTLASVKNASNCGELIRDDIFKWAQGQSVKETISRAAEHFQAGRINEAVELLKDNRQYELSRTSEDMFKANMFDLSKDELEQLTGSENLVNDRFLASGRSLFISADTGIGKSVLIFQLLIMWALGREALGFKPHRKLKSLYIGDEDDAFDIQHFFKSTKEMAELTDTEIKEAIHSITIPNTYDDDTIDPFKLIEGRLKRGNYDIVVINPMSNFIQDDLNTSTAAQSFYGKINRLMLLYKVQFIVVGHNNKPRNNSTTEKNSVYSFAGNAGFANKFRARINLVRIGDSHVFNMVISKGGKKAGFTEKLIKHNDVNPDYFYWLECAGMERTEQMELTKLEKSIYNTLTVEPVTASELADILNVSKTSIHKNVTGLKSKRHDVKLKQDNLNSQRLLYYRTENDSVFSN